METTINTRTTPQEIPIDRDFEETDLTELIKLIEKLRDEIKGVQIDDAPEDPSGSERGGRKSGVDGKERNRQAEKLKNYLDQIAVRLNHLGKFEQQFKDKAKMRDMEIRRLLEKIKTADKMKDSSELNEAQINKLVESQLKDMNKQIRKLKHQIPSWSAAAVAKASASLTPPSSTTPEAEVIDEILSLHQNNIFSKSSLYNEIKESYDHLEENEQKCLLCFAVFSENEELKKRMLAYWWAGEGLIKSESNKDIREIAGEILDKFKTMELIQAVPKKRFPEAKRFRMQPVVRAAIMKIAQEEKRFSFTSDGSFAAVFSGDVNGAPKKPVGGTDAEREKQLETPVGGQDASSSAAGQRKKQLETPVGGQDALQGKHVENWSYEDKIETLFNVNEQFPDLRVKRLAKQHDLLPDEWLLKMKALKVLYLGTWRSSGKHHIEVEGTEFLKGLKSMQNLKLLSLQGTSRINELPDSIRRLSSLEILDLKSCHNLEVLPKEISYLKNLTHLDVSNCFFLDHMPKGLSYLTKLQVLKGFVVGDYRSGKFCTLESLAAMTDLKKLSVIISKKDFPNEDELKALSALQNLQRLTLSWGADSTAGTKNGAISQKQSHQTNTAGDQQKLPEKIEKLDIQCYPHSQTPSWLSPKKLVALKKLYIRGGKLGVGCDGSALLVGAERWSSVDTLRLKYLAGIKMTWEEIESGFPQLKYLEKVDCPLITLCPCDEDGVYVK